MQTFISVLGIYPKVFTQGRFLMRQFPKWHLPKCAISQATTFHRLGWALQWGRALREGWARGPSAAAGKLLIGKLHNWEIATLENTSRKLLLGKMELGKYL